MNWGLADRDLLNQGLRVEVSGSWFLQTKVCRIEVGGSVLANWGLADRDLSNQCLTN